MLTLNKSRVITVSMPVVCHSCSVFTFTKKNVGRSAISATYNLQVIGKENTRWKFIFGIDYPTSGIYTWLDLNDNRKKLNLVDSVMCQMHACAKW